MANLKVSLDFDYKGLEKSLSEIALKKLPKAAAFYLNGIAFDARKQLIKHTAEAFDGHVRFTEKAWVYDKARPDDRDKMFSAVRALPAQAAYLKFQIDGGTRKQGDAGSGPHDLFVGAEKKNSAGNIPVLSGRLRKRVAKRRLHASVSMPAHCLTSMQMCWTLSIHKRKQIHSSPSTEIAQVSSSRRSAERKAIGDAPR